MFDLTWQEFSRRPHIAKLPLSEQTRQFHWEQQRHQMLMEYVSSAASGVGGSSGAGGGNSTVVQAIQTNQDRPVNLSTSNQYTYYFVGSDNQTDWNTVVNAASSPNVDTTNPLSVAILTGRGSNVYINNRVMGEFRLDNIPGTITDLTLSFTTLNTENPPFNVNIYDAGTTGLTGVGGEYSYYKDAGSTAFSTAQTISSDTTYTFTLNSSALTVANTKPAAFVVAAIHNLDYTATAPTVLDQIIGASITDMVLKLTYVS